MIITIRGDSIDITEIPLSHHIEWESRLNELNAERIPGWYQDGKRTRVSIVDGKAHVSGLPLLAHNGPFKSF